MSKGTSTSVCKRKLLVPKYIEAVAGEMTEYVPAYIKGDTMGSSGCASFAAKRLIPLII